MRKLTLTESVCAIFVVGIFAVAAANPAPKKRTIPIREAASVPQSFDTKAGVLYVNHAGTVNNFQGFLTDADRIYLMDMAAKGRQAIENVAKTK